jgi:hypothetical protein
VTHGSGGHETGFNHITAFGLILQGMALREAALPFDLSLLVIVYSSQVAGRIGYVFMWFIVLCFCCLRCDFVLLHVSHAV